MRRLLCVLAVSSAVVSGFETIDQHRRQNQQHDGVYSEADDKIQIQYEYDELKATEAILQDYAFTSSFRDVLQPNNSTLLPFQRQSPRKLANGDTCIAYKESCQGQSSNCCQGGCNGRNKCICQKNNAICFNIGKQDHFCCSNRCGASGRCEGIPRGGSCRVGDGFCGDGLTCGTNGKCVRVGNMYDPSSSTRTQGQQNTQPQAPKPTRNPTRKPTTKRPTRRPTTRRPTNPPVANADEGETFSTNCQPNNRVCFNRGQRDTFCCSKRCGTNGRCLNVVSASNPTPNIRTRRPTNKPTLPPTSKPTPKPTSFSHNGVPLQTKSMTSLCANPRQVQITVEIETDQFGGDLGWSIFKDKLHPRTNAVIRQVPIMQVANGTYGLFTHDKVKRCVTPGQYNLTVTDRYGDGICCAYGDGYVKVKLDNREVMHVKSYGKVMSEILNIGYDPNLVMTERDYLYLEAHNSRRTAWYEASGLTDVPLTWSPMLAEQSRVWAEKLLVNCSGAGIEHEDGVPHGENLAKNTGTVNADGKGWGQLYPPTNIVGRWVEFEIKRPYPGNAHLTQALWRPAKYMGCGEAEKPFRTGMCRVQVCRYSRAGNCDMGRYNATEGKNWLPPMLADTSRCGPNCPPEGCY